MLKQQFFIFAVEDIKSLIRPPAATNVLEYSFGKRTKKIKCMTQKSSQVSFLGKSSSKKLPVKIYGQSPCITAVKNLTVLIFLSEINETLLLSFKSAKTVDIAAIMA